MKFINVSHARGRLSTTFIVQYSLNYLLYAGVFPPALSKIICAGLAAERFRVRGTNGGGGNRTRDCRTAVPRAINLVNQHSDLASARCILS
jgi:hypothetical protein